MENVDGALSSLLLYERCLTAKQVEELQVHYPLGFATSSALQDLNSIPTDALIVALSPLGNAGDSIANQFQTPGFAEVKAVLKGNCGIQVFTQDFSRQRYLDPIQNVLPFLHFSRTTT